MKIFGGKNLQKHLLNFDSLSNLEHKTNLKQKDADVEVNGRSKNSSHLKIKKKMVGLLSVTLRQTEI